MMRDSSGFLRAIRRRVGRSTKRLGLKNDRAQRRRLLLEPLEHRRLLALTVESLTPTPSGFVAQFNNPIDASVLNLYDAENGALGAADVTLTGATAGPIKGSLVVRDNELTFIATGGVLPADTYTVTLRSAADAIKDRALGELLDGEFNGTFPSGDGTPGGNFQTTFTAAPQALVISLPDFARGPTQPVNVPAQGSGQELPDGLPIQVNNAEGVTSLLIKLRYDPELIDITAVALGPNAPAGSQVEGNFSTPGEVTIGFFSLAPLPSGSMDLFRLTAAVPESAPYGAAQVLTLSDLEVNAGTMEATADSAIHVVAFPGDANANRRYDTEDARLVARVGVGLDSGLAVDQPTATPSPQLRTLYPAIDPVLIGDVTGREGLSPLDASDILRKVVGLSTPNIPAIPDQQAPTSLQLSSTTLAEGQPIGTVVGTLSTIDPDVGDTHTYSLVDGTGSTDNSLFSIEGNQLRTAAVLDRETQTSYSLRIRTTDQTGRFLEQVFTITLTEVNDAPTAIALSNLNVAENQAAGALVGIFSTTDPDAGDTHTYTLVAGEGDSGNSFFTIVGNELRTAQVLDFETLAAHTIRVRSTDQGGLFTEQAFTITVLDINEAPTAIALSSNAVAENQPIGTVVGLLSTSDVDAGDSHAYALVAGEGDADNESFTIVGNEIRANAVFDVETKSSYTIRVRSTDQGGLFTEQIFTILVTGANEAPTAVALSNDSVAENSPVGTLVGLLSTEDDDPGDTHVYTLVAGEGDTGNASFALEGNELRTAAELDFESQSTYTIRVRSTDQGGLFVEQVLTINVTDVNEAPTGVTLDSSSVSENLPAGTVVGSFSATDPDAGDTHTFSLVAGEGDAGNAAFEIVGNELRTVAELDFETQATYSIRVRVTDQDGLFSDHLLTITVIDANDAPTGVALSNTVVPENEPIGTLVGLLTTTDPDEGDTHTYSLVAGDGDDDNASFTLIDDEIRTAEVFDQSTKSNYTVRVRSTDQEGLFTEQAIVITISETNEAPTAVSLAGDSVAEDAAIGAVVGLFSTTDPNLGDTHTYSLVAGAGDTDNAAFTIVGNELRTATELDFETQNSYSVRVRSADPWDLFTEQAFTITVTDVNEAPTALALSNSTVAEDAPGGTVVGTLSATDPDAGDVHTFALVAGDGDTDNASFAIVGNELQTVGPLDFESQASYSVRVQATDQGGLTLEQVFTITVTDVNEAPTALALSSSTVAEDAPAGTVVGTLSATDPDAGDVHTFALVAGAGDTDNASFAIVGNELQTVGPLDFETQASYSIRVEATDQGGLTVEQILTITVTDVNEAPTALALSNTSVAEDAPAGTVVGTLSATDPDAGDTHTFALVAGAGDTDNASFAIVGNELQTVGPLDFETQASYSIRVEATDQGGLTVEQILTITVTDVNEAPTAVALSNSTVAEDAPAGTVVGTLSATDPDAGDVHTFALVAGAGDTDNASFIIVGNELQTVGPLDFETQASYSVRVEATDQGGLTVEQILTITVTDVNEAPAAVALSNSTVAEDAPAGTVVGTLSATDPDAGDVHTFALVAGAGDTDNASFAIVGNELQTVGPLDFETQASYSIRVQATDQGGLTVEQILTITVTDVNEAPTALALSSLTVPDNSPIDTVVGTFSTTDPDAGDTHSYSLVIGGGDADNAAFTIVGNELRMAEVTDQGTTPTYSIRVRSTDDDGLFIEEIFIITVV